MLKLTVYSSVVCIYHSCRTFQTILQPIISLEVKDPLSDLEKSCIVCKFNCSCERIYIGQTTRHLKIRIKEHIPRCVEGYITGKKFWISKAVINAAKRSAISEHLINNANCAEKYNISMFSIMKQMVVLKEQFVFILKV